ncbi:uncharacterized protein LOC103579964 [Microplitis demolitor]|uniref:uncharacterized protein LOC103579964 n=1 Tax=Microplitis demolitor TaxID=69319 RepID=UPI0004CD42CE|nr:uncharacterized protein LOC103579964 [Microplitis demolitor]
MVHFYLSGVTIWALIIIIKLNVSLVTSKLVSIQQGDPSEWRQYGEKANFDKFNSVYAVNVDEELLRMYAYCSGKCDGLESWQQSFIPRFLRYPNSCRGIIHSCWLQKESERRKAAENRIYEVLKKYAGYVAYLPENHRKLTRELIEAKENRDHTGNDCTCVCERTHNDEVDLRGELVDSICYDPVSVDNGYVATGVRFKRHGNIIYLELQQGILSGGRIDPNTLVWKISDKCSSAKKVIYEWRSDNTHVGLEIILEDMILPENAVVTGITFGQSLRGRYLNDNGDFNDDADNIVKESQCPNKSVPDLMTNCGSTLLPTSLVGENKELSKSCENKIKFCASDEGTTGYFQHTVPYIDLREIVTDQSSPAPLSGIGWYYRGHPGYGGFLTLKVFIRK